ncbi:MAG: hypothetical protein WCA78_00540 [Rhizomicrobium sp.]
MNARGPFETLEGAVARIPEGGKALYFRESGLHHDLCIPLSQIEDAEAVKVGDVQINVTRWILNRLEEEGKR